jgi:tRNA(Ile)-lysidine synthase TilS/MesJ/thiol-disulfide isomerase/thioredoxin
MIEDGDRLLLGLSGGKDSLALLHVLVALQKKAPVRFTIACATVDPGTPSFDPSPLIPYMKELGIEYHYLRDSIIERAATELDGDSLCSYCSRMKRGMLYTCCRTHGFNKLILAQHLDDMAESLIMSVLHNGCVRTMKAKYMNNEGDVCIIRPLAYTREVQMKEFSYAARLPVINENCPACFEEPKERHRVKKMLANEESLCPSIYANMRRALIPFMDNSIYRGMKIITTTVQSRKHANRKGNIRQGSKKQKVEHAHGGAAGSQWSLRQPRLPGSKRKQLQLLRAQLKEEGDKEADSMTNHALLELLQKRGGLAGGSKGGGKGDTEGSKEVQEEEVEELATQQTLWGMVALDALKELDDAALLQELARRGLAGAAGGAGAVGSAAAASAGTGGGGVPVASAFDVSAWTAQNAVAQQATGASSRALWAKDLLGQSLLLPAVSVDDGGRDTREVLHGSSDAGVVGIYFSAKWCPPCREFTPLLKQLYMQQKQNSEFFEDRQQFAGGFDFEVVFVSADRVRSKFCEYASTMPWLAMPFEEREAKEALEDKYGVKSLPTLVLVDKCTGRVISQNAVAEVTEALQKTESSDGAPSGAQQLLSRWSRGVQPPAIVHGEVSLSSTTKGGMSHLQLVACAALSAGVASFCLWRATR